MVLEMQNNPVVLPEDDMNSMAPRALKSRSMRCNQIRERSNEVFLASAVYEYSHVLMGFESTLPQDMMFLSAWRVSATGNTS